MKTTTPPGRIRIKHRPFIGAVFVIGLAALCFSEKSTQAAPLYSDTFSGTTLNSALWSANGQNGVGSVTVGGGHLAITGGGAAGYDYQAWYARGVSGAGWSVSDNATVSLDFLTPNITTGNTLTQTLWLSDGVNSGSTFFTNAQKAVALELLYDYYGDGTSLARLYGKSTETASTGGTMVWTGKVTNSAYPLVVDLQVDGTGYTLGFNQTVTTLTGSLTGLHGVTFNSSSIFANISNANGKTGRGTAYFDNYSVNVVPEPSTALMVLLAGGLVTLMVRRRHALR